MNDYLLSILLGIVEGLTEFLPVSSTAHIRLVLGLWDESLLKDGYWKMYTVVIQLGAILSVFVYFRNRIAEFLKSFHAQSTLGARLRHPLTLVMLAFFVTAIPSFLLSKTIKSNLESLYVMGIALVVGGVVMWVVDVIFGKREKLGLATKRMEEIKPFQAVVVGAVQILSAVFPGTSRSMATIAGGQLAGLSRSAALEFSFFLSMPIMVAAGLFDLRESITAPPGDGAYIEGGMTAHRWGVLAVGFVVSFIVALGVIHWFMGWVRTRGFVPFAIYRILIGIVVIIWASRIA
jgi:undecaprenyl-diphosphatase